MKTTDHKLNSREKPNETSPNPALDNLFYGARKNLKHNFPPTLSRPSYSSLVISLLRQHR